MEDFLFENRYYGTDRLLHEYVFHFVCKKQLRTGFLICLAALVLSLAFLAAGHPILALLFLPAFFRSLYITVKTPRSILKTIREEDQKLHQGEKPETVIRFGGEILITEGEHTLKEAYSAVTKILFLKHCWLLVFSKTSGLQVLPGCFTVGTPDEFLRFLRSKCPQAKWSASKAWH